MGIYFKEALIGGASNALDGINGSSLVDGDRAFVNMAEKLYHYKLDDDLGAAAAKFPEKIPPVTNPGTKMWVLQKVFSRTQQDEVCDHGALTTISLGAMDIGRSHISRSATRADFTLPTTSSGEAGSKIEFRRKTAGGLKVTTGGNDLLKNAYTNVENSVSGEDYAFLRLKLIEFGYGTSTSGEWVEDGKDGTWTYT